MNTRNLPFHTAALAVLFALAVFTACSSRPEGAGTRGGQGLVAHFEFEGNLSDSTGRFADGAVIGSKVYESRVSNVSYEAGIRGEAVVFNGRTGVRLPDGLITGHRYSVALWVKPQIINAFTTTFFGGVTVGSEQEWISIIPAGPGGESMLWAGNNPYIESPVYTRIRTDEWSHFAVSVDEGEVRVYLNGTERFAGSGFPDVFDRDDVLFALGVNYWDPAFRGSIDDLRIYDTILTPEEIAELAQGAAEIAGGGPVFRNVAVHDPIVTKAGDTYYIFGSHLAVAKSDDLMQWTQIVGDWNPNNPVIPNPHEELREAMEWPEPDAESTWAANVIELNGRYHMYFSTAHWDSPRSTISLAVSDSIEGPYSYEGIVIRKYENGEYSEEAGEPFDYSIHPGVIDPQVFFDAEGGLWMVYGSFAGGMHILEMDPTTGYPKPGQGYGTRIAGGNHTPMEGPFILDVPETDYYYLMVTFGTLASDGGYNIRVARSRNPDGPYLDPSGHDMADMMNLYGRNWRTSEPYGAKLNGNFLFEDSGIGYLSPGHNSAIIDGESGRIFAIFHSRFPGMGEMHSVRVHQLFVNENEWLVMAPHRYAGETIETYTDEEIIGTYQYLNLGKRIQYTFGTPGGDIITSEHVELSADGLITGAVSGTWERSGDRTAAITIDGTRYDGVFLRQWDDGLRAYVMTFTALSADGVTVWGSLLP